MNLYFTPTRRMNRRAWARPYRQENDWAEAECDVFVPVNVRAESDAFVITALLPGVKADDLSIQVVNETVTIQGEIKEQEQEDAAVLLRECPTGKFYRVLRLPEPLDAAKASAELVDGRLTLRVAKVEEAKPKTIKVHAN
jgi:HSP20 family protein